MAKIITLAHQKGGVGKSTLALNLALCFRDALSVALADTDPQGSVYHNREDFPGLAIIGIDKLQEIQKLPFDLIIADTPPYLSSRLPELFLYSDFILVPTKPGFFDVMAIRSTLALIADAQEKKPQIKAGIVLNMVKARSSVTKDISELLETLGTPLLKTRIHDRVSITRSVMTGGIINANDIKAKDEIMALAEEVVEKINAES